jgi:hypothetical protein
LYYLNTLLQRAESLIVLPDHIAAEGKVPGELAHVVACHEDDEQLIVLPEHIAAEGRVPGELAHVVAGH